jgi:hypothetical protein
MKFNIKLLKRGDLLIVTPLAVFSAILFNLYFGLNDLITFLVGCIFHIIISSILILIKSNKKDAKSKVLAAWIEFYNKNSGEEDFLNDVSVESFALGFFISKGLSLEEAFNLYHTECIQLGVF